MLLTILFARGHIKNYWNPNNQKDARSGKDVVGVRAPVPGMEDYNTAQRKTEDLLKVLEWLEYSWLASSFFGALVGYG